MNGNNEGQPGKLKIWHEKIGVLFDVHKANQFLLYEEINREGTACSGGSSLFVTTGSSVVANVTGGVLNRAVQGKSTTVGDVMLDAGVGTVGAVAGHFAGNYVEKVLEKVSKGVKGDIGEAITKFKYTIKGYVDKGKAEVLTGANTKTGLKEKAIYDFSFENFLTGKNITVESKFNTASNPPTGFYSGFTRNQRLAAPNVTTPGGLIVDRSSSTQLGNATKALIRVC